MVQTTFVKQKV